MKGSTFIQYNQDGEIMSVRIKPVVIPNIKSKNNIYNSPKC